MATHTTPDWVQVSVAFSAGVLLLVPMPDLPPLWWLVSAAGVVCGLFTLPLFWCRLLACVLAGWVWACAFAQWRLDGLLPFTGDNAETVLTGSLKDFPRRDQRGWQFDFESVSPQATWRLTLHDETSQQESPRFDCRYQLRVKLRRPRGLLNEGLYDYGLWLLQAGYSGTGSVKAITGCEPQQPGMILRWREQLAIMIRRVPLSDEARGTLMGLLIGSYADVDSAQWQLWRDSGTIHLLSVSGLHITLVAGLVYALVTRLCSALLFPLRIAAAANWGAAAALLFALIYALLAGFSVATQRSLWMVAVSLLQLMWRGRFAFGTSFWLSCAAVLILNPLAIFSVGFWFSFWATAVLLLAGYGWQRRPGSTLLRWAGDACRLQLALFLTVAPVLCHSYGKVTLVSIPMNLLVVPWASLVSLPLGLLACLANPLSSWLADGLLQVSGWSLDLYWQAMRWAVVRIGWAQFYLAAADLAVVVLAAGGVTVAMLSPRGLPLRQLGWLCCLPLLWPAKGMPMPGGFRAQVLDVGQGLAVIVQTARHTLVYDTGDRRSERFDAGRDIVAPALRLQQVQQLDMLVLSHADSDHSGGAAGLMDVMETRSLWSGTPEQQQFERSVLPCRAGMHWRWEGVDFATLNPATDGSQKDNDRSCVLAVAAGSRRLLLTGDIEAQAEARLVATGEQIRADVLVVPHHGSKTSSTPGFLQAVAPELAVISAGYANRFHHPHSSVVARLDSNSHALVNTAFQGEVILDFRADGSLSWRTALCSERRFWLSERQHIACGK